MESRLQSNEIRIPKRSITLTSSPSNAIITSANNSTSTNSTLISASTTSGNATTSTTKTTTSYLAINLTNPTNNNNPSNLNSCNNKNTNKSQILNSTNIAVTSSTITRNQSTNNKVVENLNNSKSITSNGNKTSTFMKDILSKSSDKTSITPSITNIVTPLPDFDLDAPCHYFKSSFARSLSLAGCTNNGTSEYQTKSLDFGINFGLSRNSPITEETSQEMLNNIFLSSPTASPVTTTVSSGLIFSTINENQNYNKIIQQEQMRNKTNKMMSLTNNDSTAYIGNSMESNNINNANEMICNGTTTNASRNSSFSPRKMKFLNGNGNNNNNNTNSNNIITNNNSSNSNSNVWSTSSSTPTSASSNSASSLKKQNFNRRSLDSSEIELLRLRKECQNLVEENRRLMGLASGMVRGNLIIPGNSSNIEAVILQNQVDTLQWQLKQVEASREMYRAVMEEVVRFLERCHQNLENLQNQSLHQQQLSSISSSTSSSSNCTATTIRPRSMHQMTSRHNDINSVIESDTSSIRSSVTVQQQQQQQQPPPPISSKLTASTTASTTTTSASVLNQSTLSSLSSIFSNHNLSPRARSSTNLIDANNSKKNNKGSNLIDDISSIGESTISAATNNTAISHNNFRDFTWRRSPKRQQIAQLAASASRDAEKLAQEAFRLLRTAQNLLNTQEPDLTQSKLMTTDLSFISNCSSNIGNNSMIHHHTTPSNGGISSVSVIPSSVNAINKPNSIINLETDPFLMSTFSRKVNMRESRLSLRSSTDSSVHSTTSSLSKTETDEENNTTLQQIQNNKIGTNNSDPNKESPVCSSTISSSTTEDESGFSSISSFQEIGLPLHSTMLSNTAVLLNNTNCSLGSSNSDETSGNKTLGGFGVGGRGETTLILESRNSSLKSIQQQNLVNGIGLPSSPMHRRWDSAPAVPPRNSLHRFSTVNHNGDEGPTVLWV